MTNEQDHRIGILNSLLTTPHRDLSKIDETHRNVVESDPLFYQKLGCWFFDNGTTRDSKEVFVANLCINEDESLRDTGLALLRQLPPYEVRRVVDFIKSKRNVPRSVVTEITRYLREREEKKNWFDSSALRAKKHLKRLYAMLHIRPSERAQKILFENNPPKDSAAYLVKELSKATTPLEQAEKIIKNKIPYTIASSVVKEMTPTVLFALIEVMSNQELINNLGSLKKRGAFDNHELKHLIKHRLEEAKKDNKVAALKSVKAAESAQLDEETNEELMDIADKQIKSKGRITRPTALFVDKSFSMSEGIEVGKQMATVVSSVMNAPFYVYAFDVMPYKIDSSDLSLDGWNKAFRGIKARGGTNPGAPFSLMIRNNERVEQIVLITDEGENRPNWYLSGLQEYEKHIGESVDTFILRCGKPNFRHRVITNSLQNAGKNVDDYEFDGDYYSLPNLVSFLSQPSKLDLLMEIMSYPLPRRKSH